MKKGMFIGLLCLISNFSWAQPQKINYQGVAVGANGKAIKNASVGLRLSVLDSLPTGSTLYTETQSASTDAAGQFLIYLGAGTATLGTFANIPWANGNDKFLKVEMDAQGGSNYQNMGTTQLVSVPFAMAAGSLREGAIFYGINGQKFQLVNGASGPAWTCYPPVIQANAGNDQLSLTGTTATLAANTPAAGETGTWTIITGSGASLNNANSSTATFTKGTDSAYTLVWTITGSCGTSKDTVNIHFSAPAATVCGQSVTYAGETYPTVQIGTQCWFSKNLNVGMMVSLYSGQWNNSTIEKFCYDGNLTNCSTYGGLYQWGEAVNYVNGASNNSSANLTNPYTDIVTGICPSGWHLPNDLDWNLLRLGLGGQNVAGGPLKSVTGLWISPNTGATNGTGFSALPSGGILSAPPYSGIGTIGYFWSSSESSNTGASYRYLVNTSNSFFDSTVPKSYGFSIRCIQN